MLACSATGHLSDSSSHSFSLLLFFTIPPLKSGDLSDPPADLLHYTLSTLLVGTKFISNNFGNNFFARLTNYRVTG